ncbi:MAG: UPF0716 family protein affecting phage T7 exclusion [Sulfurimonas sp.]|jgi:UPF0716 family protein affecting phage T7 exclusion
MNIEKESVKSTLTCFVALFFTSLNAFEIDMLVWIPNIAGSILFLIASFLAWLEIYKDRSIASFVYANSELVNETMALYCTLFGGVCFFIGAFLLTIEIREQTKAL